MKVVCVDDGPNRNDRTVEPNGRIQNGEIYTVVSIERRYWGDGYEIAEKPTLLLPEMTPWKWSASRFVPLTYHEAEFQVSESLDTLAEPHTGAATSLTSSKQVAAPASNL